MVMLDVLIQAKLLKFGVTLVVKMEKLEELVLNLTAFVDQLPRRKSSTVINVKRERTKDVLMEILIKPGACLTVLRVTVPSLTVNVLQLPSWKLLCFQSVRLVSMRPLPINQLLNVILVKKESMPDVLMETPTKVGATQDVKQVKTTGNVSNLTVNVELESPQPQNVMKS